MANSLTIPFVIVIVGGSCAFAGFANSVMSGAVDDPDEMPALVVHTNSLEFHLRSLGRTPSEEELQIISATLELMQRYQIPTDSPLRSVAHDCKENEWYVHFGNGDPNGTFTISLRDKNAKSFRLQPTMIASQMLSYPEHAEKLAAQRWKAARSIAWKDTQEFKWRVRSFRIKPKEASRIANMACDHLGHLIGEDPNFLVGRWYCFGMKARIGAPLEGYYVNGDTGQVEYRDSEKQLKRRDKELPDHPWAKITRLPGSEPTADK